MTDFASLVFRNVADTALYLMAYRGAPLAALAGTVILIRFLPGAAARRWADAGGIRGAWGGCLLALATPFRRDDIGTRLVSLSGRPAALIGYLAVSHAVTGYYLLMLGPLLGKDVLFSHLIGAAVFVPAAIGCCRLLGYPTAGPSPDNVPILVGGASAPPDRRPLPASLPSPSLACIIRCETARAATLMLAGLVLGGIVAAWGLSARRPALVELIGSDGGAQLANATLGLGLSMLTFMPPITNLFVATYLWKIGLAHAGLVAFLYAATVSPQRIRMYRRHLDSERAWKLAAALAAAAIVSGVVTAWLFRVTPLSINYKLIPAQMW